jgi:hypothetical protein
MKEWRVYSKQEPGSDHRGVIIWWPAWDEREAKDWFRENVEGSTPDHFYFGATLELAEFESDLERAIRERDEARTRVAELIATERENEKLWKCLGNR